MTKQQRAIERYQAALDAFSLAYSEFSQLCQSDTASPEVLSEAQEAMHAALAAADRRRDAWRRTVRASEVRP